MNKPAESNRNNNGYWLALFGMSAVLLYLLAPVIMPFLVAALLAYLGDPIVDLLEKYHFPRAAAVSTVFLLIFVVLIALPIIVLPLLEQQMTALLHKLPKYVQWFQSNIQGVLGQYFNIDPSAFSQAEIKQALAKYWQQIGGFAGHIFKAMSTSGLVLIAMVANAILIPVVTFYLLRDWDVLVDKIHKLLPRQYEQKISEVVRESDNILGEFLRGQLMVMICLSVVYGIGLSLTGLDLAILIGVVAGLVSFVPYLGFIVGIVFAGVATYMQFQDFLSLLPVLAVFTVGQLLEGMVLTPKLVGDKIGLHPVAVIFSVMAGGQLFGVVGVLLALPVAAVIVVVLRHSLEQYTNSSLYRDST